MSACSSLLFVFLKPDNAGRFWTLLRRNNTLNQNVTKMIGIPNFMKKCPRRQAHIHIPCQCETPYPHLPNPGNYKTIGLSPMACHGRKSKFLQFGTWILATLAKSHMNLLTVRSNICNSPGSFKSVDSKKKDFHEKTNETMENALLKPYFVKYRHSMHNIFTLRKSLKNSTKVKCTKVLASIQPACMRTHYRLLSNKILSKIKAHFFVRLLHMERVTQLGSTGMLVLALLCLFT